MNGQGQTETSVSHASQETHDQKMTACPLPVDSPVVKAYRDTSRINVPNLLCQDDSVPAGTATELAVAKALVGLASAGFTEPPAHCFTTAPKTASGRAPKDIHFLPDYSLLNECERNFCRARRIDPRPYLEVRRKMFIEFHRICSFDERGRTTRESRAIWTKSKAQKVGGIDANNISAMYQWYDELNLWEQSWPLNAGHGL